MARPALIRPARRPLANGAVLAVALAALAELTSRALQGWLNPDGPSPVSPVLCAVLLGVAWRNTIGLSPGFVPGLQWITNTLLRLGIALVGLRLSLDGLASTAAVALPVVVGCVTTALLVSVGIGKLLGLPQPMRFLLAAGTAVCGCTAVCAITPVVRARAVDSGLAITCVVLLGCTGMLVYPWLAHTFFGNSAEAAGVFLGTAIHDTSQVVGASLIYAQQFGMDDAVPVAGFTKLLRNLSLLVLVPLFVLWSMNERGGQAQCDAPGTEKARVRRSQVLPAFLVAFVVLALVRTLGDEVTAGTTVVEAWSQLIAAGLGASELFLVCGMTAVGLNVSIADLRGVGSRALLAALAVAAAVCACSLALTYALTFLASRSGLGA
jgi:uncharacterized integral membrane protein (TIGR00698 family)